jgi:Zn-dependent protease
VTPKGIWMIPFMGGMAFMNPPQTRGQEAVIALGGPLFGLLSVPVIAGVWPLTGDRAWAAYAAIVALVNLFNLLPIGILDGGRVTQAVAASIHSRLGIAFYGVGMLVGAAAAVWTHSLVIAVILVLGLMETGRNILRGSYDAMPKMTGGPNTLAFLSYLALVLLFLGAIAGLAMIPGADLAARVMGD